MTADRPTRIVEAAYDELGPRFAAGLEILMAEVVLWVLARKPA
jgi:hypothetical protein